MPNLAKRIARLPPVGRNFIIIQKGDKRCLLVLYKADPARSTQLARAYTGLMVELVSSEPRPIPCVATRSCSRQLHSFATLIPTTDDSLSLSIL